MYRDAKATVEYRGRGMNAKIFERLVRKEWTEIKNEFPGYEYNYTEVLNIFRYFFLRYKQYRGEEHPNVRREQIRRYILLMPVDGSGDDCSYEIYPDDYPLIIDAYFKTRFDDNCDYRLHHFFSGEIRLYRWFEKIYRGE